MSQALSKGDDSEDVGVPISIDSNTLRFLNNESPHTTSTDNELFYIIGGKRFTLSEIKEDVTEQVVSFEMYAKKKKRKKNDHRTSFQNAFSIEQNMDDIKIVVKDIPKKTKDTNYTFLYERDCYIIMQDDDPPLCFVCNKIVEFSDMSEHIQSNDHIVNIGLWKPTDVGDTNVEEGSQKTSSCSENSAETEHVDPSTAAPPIGSIFEVKIKNMLHCPVCNIPYSIETINEHMNSGTHLEQFKKSVHDIDISNNTYANLTTNGQSNDTVNHDKVEQTQVQSNNVGKDDKVKPTIQLSKKIVNDDKVNQTNQQSNNIIKGDKVKQTNKQPNNIVNNDKVKQTNGQSNNIVSDDRIKKEKVNKNDTDTAKSIDERVNEFVNTTVASSNEHDKNVNRIDEVDINDDVKPDVNVSDNNKNADASTDLEFDNEEFVYLKLKNLLVKVTNSAYNSLVHVGDGTRYCFVCSLRLYDDIQKHVETNLHINNIEKCRFLDNYEGDFIRQVILQYHCAICNVLILRKHLKHHLEWPSHTEQAKDKKAPKTKTKNTKTINVDIQRENVHQKPKDQPLKIIFNVQIKDHKMDKIVIFNDTTFKVGWENWNGVAINNNRFKCYLCQVEFSKNELGNHIGAPTHISKLATTIDKEYSPALIRIISQSYVHCVTCNVELPHRKHIIQTHTIGKRHAKKHYYILKETSKVNAGLIPNDNVLIL